MACLTLDASAPGDVRLLHGILTRPLPPVVHCANCGTAMRFLTAYFAQRAGIELTLDGSERMRRRPVGQLVDALRQLGADIEYRGEEGFPPLHIRGRQLQHKKVSVLRPQSTQFVSALLLIGADVVTDCRSPYIDMTRTLCNHPLADEPAAIERDWSAAAFWYEWVALHGGTLFLEGLCQDSLQGDRIVADLFSRFGVRTTYRSDGVLLEAMPKPCPSLAQEIDFSACPDLYPAVFATCVRLGIRLPFTGLERLPLKESDRLAAMRQLVDEPQKEIYRTFGDHRIAMAMLCAGYGVDDTDCISKSYPQFMEQWRTLPS